MCISPNIHGIRLVVVSSSFAMQEAFKLLDSDSESVHYVYACRKHDLSAGDR